MLLEGIVREWRYVCRMAAFDDPSSHLVWGWIFAFFGRKAVQDVVSERGVAGKRRLRGGFMMIGGRADKGRRCGKLILGIIMDASCSGRSYELWMCRVCRFCGSRMARIDEL